MICIPCIPLWIPWWWYFLSGNQPSVQGYYLKNGWLDLYHHFGVKSSFLTPHNWSSCDDIAGWHRSVTPWPGDIRSRAMACRLRSRHTPLMTKTWRSPSICLDPLRHGTVAFNLRHFDPRDQGDLWGGCFILHTAVVRNASKRNG